MTIIRRWLRFWALVIGSIVLGLGMIAWGVARANAHDWYSGQRSKASSKNGWTCCNGNDGHGDCKTVRATLRADGVWVGVYNGREYTIPDDAMMPDETNGNPLEASMCVHQGRVLCFWKRAAGG